NYAMKTDGTLWSWGSNSLGQLGNGSTVSQSSPIQIGASTSWTSIQAGGLSSSSSNFALATQSNGSLWAWGDNSNGGLGNGTTVNSSSPVQIGFPATWTSIIPGGTFALGMRK